MYHDGENPEGHAEAAEVGAPGDEGSCDEAQESGQPESEHGNVA